MTETSRNYLHSRGITDEAIERFSIGGDDEKIIIPIQGFNKYRSFPKKSYWYDIGFKASIFGLAQLEGLAWCVLTEGELDALRLNSERIPACSGTGGAKTFKDEWVALLPKHVFICYDTDQVGRQAALAVHWRIPGSKIITLPEGKDVTEYLEHHTKKEFEELIKQATAVPKPPDKPVFRSEKKRKVEVPKEVPITDFIQFRQNKAKCIWHQDSTPSMHYYPQTNTVHCFGCGHNGDVVDVVMQLRGIGFREALTVLKNE